MCGIIGCIANRQLIPDIIEGLKRLEYRGYDSAGLVLFSEGNSDSYKAVGRVSELEEKVRPMVDSIYSSGIAHTRWATHGVPSEANCHPHADCQSNFFVVHNGVFENYLELKGGLGSHNFVSATDTEVLPHLLEDNYSGDVFQAACGVLPRLVGSFALAIVHKGHPGEMIIAKEKSPLILGRADGEYWVGSDVNALPDRVKEIYYLNDGDIIHVKDESVFLYNIGNNDKTINWQSVERDTNGVGKNGYDDFMLKEIEEQPNIIEKMLAERIADGKVDFPELGFYSMKNFSKIYIIGCGSAYLAGQLGAMHLRAQTGKEVEVVLASEFRYNDDQLHKDGLAIVISQSGETADTKAALEKAKGAGMKVLSIVNVENSSIDRMSDLRLYSKTGPEMAVASTKAFLAQGIMLMLLAVWLSPRKHLSEEVLAELKELPKKIYKTINSKDSIQVLAEKFKDFENWYFLGRKYSFPIILEGALKLKEISYIHAEGYPSGEMKHGPIALIDEKFVSLFVIPSDSVFEKNFSNAQEINARGGQLIFVTDDQADNLDKLSPNVLVLPKTDEMFSPFINVVALQLLAYYIAKVKGRDVDRPRNLAKSVTVE